MTVTQPVPSRAAEILSRPVSLNGLTVPNRIAMAPMTRMFSPGGVPGEDVRSYYARRAAARRRAHRHRGHLRRPRVRRAERPGAAVPRRGAAGGLGEGRRGRARGGRDDRAAAVAHRDGAQARATRRTPTPRPSAPPGLRVDGTEGPARR